MNAYTFGHYDKFSIGNYVVIKNLVPSKSSAKRLKWKFLSIEFKKLTTVYIMIFK